MTENYNDISKQIDGYISHLEENEKKVKEYKNQALRLTLQIEEIKENNTSTIKQVLKSKQTYIIAGSIMTTIVSLCSAFYYYATYIGFEF